MGVLTYNAKRNVIVGHTIGLSYSIETAFQILDDNTEQKGTERKMLDATVEYELDFIVDVVTVMSDEVAEADKLLWREFTTSVAAREQFQIDLTGTIAAPGTVRNCKIANAAGFHPMRTKAGVQSYKFNLTVRFE